MKEEQIKNYINENKRIWEANELSVEEIAERCLLDGEQLGVDKLNDTARLLQILKDRGVIKSWYYNGSYHIGEVAELEKENETLEPGYVWDYMTQSKVTTKIVTKEKGVTMIEKEAEEKTLEQPYTKDYYYYGFKDGAEFGYNKANEWHYVKDGDLPKDDNYVLVSNGKDWTKGFYKDKKWNIISLVGFTKIIMWKEIVLPKESE